MAASEFLALWLEMAAMQALMTRYRALGRWSLIYTEIGARFGFVT